MLEAVRSHGKLLLHQTGVIIVPDGTKSHDLPYTITSEMGSTVQTLKIMSEDPEMLEVILNAIKNFKVRKPSPPPGHKNDLLFSGAASDAA